MSQFRSGGPTSKVRCRGSEVRRRSSKVRHRRFFVGCRTFEGVPPHFQIAMTHLRGGPAQVVSGGQSNDGSRDFEEEKTANLANRANLLRSGRAAWGEEFSRKKAQKRRKRKTRSAKSSSLIRSIRDLNSKDLKEEESYTPSTKSCRAFRFVSCGVFGALRGSITILLNKCRHVS